MGAGREGRAGEGERREKGEGRGLGEPCYMAVGG